MDHRYPVVRQGSSLWRSLRDGDFEEEEVWDVLRDRKDSSTAYKFRKSMESSPVHVPKNAYASASASASARMIPSSGGSSNYSSHESKTVVQQSAPVNIPDWSKISRKKSNKKSSRDISASWLDDFDDVNDDCDNGGMNDVAYSDDDEDDDCDSEYNDKLPPHELISRRLARSQISSFSVFEGVGRTLKGRDLSKVRNAVLTKTGFLESL